MSEHRSRDRRSHVTVRPARGSVDLSTLSGDSHDDRRSEFTVLDPLLRKAESLDADEPSSDPVTAPVELLVTQHPSRGISYTVSLSESISGPRRSAVQRAIEENYYVTGESRPFDFVFTADSPAMFDFIELWPPGAFTAHVPQFPISDAGDIVTALVKWLRSSEKRWVLQVLVAPCAIDRDIHPAHEDDAIVALQVRAAIQTKENGTHRRSKPPTTLEQPPAGTALRMTEAIHRETVLSEMRAAQIQVERAFVAPAAYARGLVFPPSRVSSLTHGIPGTVSPLHAAPSQAVKRIVSPRLPVGTEPDYAPISSGDQSTRFEFDRGCRVGLPESSGAVLTVEANHLQRLQTAEQELLAHRETEAPTFVLSTDPAVQKQCVETYCASRLSEGSSLAAVLDDVEYVSGDTIESVLKASFMDAAQHIAPWLTSESGLYVFDVSATPDPRRSSVALLSRLTRVAARPDTAETQTIPAGNVLYFSSWPPYSSAGTESPVGADLRDALSRVHDAGLFVTLHTLYPEVKVGTLVTDWTRYNRLDRDVQYQSLAQLTRRVDAVLASPAGPVDRLFHEDRMTVANGWSPAEIARQYSDEYWVGVFTAGSVDSHSFAVPVKRLTATGDGADVSLNPEQRTALHATLTGSAATSDEAGGGESDADSAADVNREPGREHAVRAPDDVAITYDDGRDGYVCEQCRGSKRDAQVYERSLDGLMRAVTCCHSLEEVDREALRHVPDPVLGLTDAEIDEHELTRAELRFLTVIYLVQAGECDHALEYDPLTDSGLDIREDLGVSYEVETRLADDGYLVRTNSPSKLYSLTDRGLAAIGVDVETTSELPSMYEQWLRRAATAYFTAEYAIDTEYSVEQDVSCPVAATESTQPSFATLDVAVQAPDGSIVAGVGLWPPVTGIRSPGETAANETRPSEVGDADDVAATDDAIVTYQTLTAVEPDDAVWCVWRQQDGNELVSYLRAASDAGLVSFSHDGYGENVRIQDFDLDEPGITDIMTIKHLLDAINPEWIGSGAEYELAVDESGESDA